MQFVVKERLRWGDGGDLMQLKPQGRPFECDGSSPFCFPTARNKALIAIHPTEDIKILYNDWPYGVEHGIIHLVVWTKFELEDDPATDDLTPRARREIDDYVNETFCSRVPSEQVPLPLPLHFHGPPLTTPGDLVQELEIAEIRPRCRALPCHAVQSRHALRPGNHPGRRPLDCNRVMLLLVFTFPSFKR